MDIDAFRDMWDDRYNAKGAVWGLEPNRFLVEIADGLSPRRVLDLGCGQGRNSLWLAAQGHTVTGLDLSPVAIDQAREAAAKLGLDITFEAVDLSTWDPAGQEWDLVILTYLHLPDDLRRIVHRTAREAVAPGGTVAVIAHHLENLTTGAGGPQNAELLFTETQLAEDFAGFDVERNEKVIRSTNAGDAIDIVLVARKP